MKAHHTLHASLLFNIYAKRKNCGLHKTFNDQENTAKYYTVCANTLLHSSCLIRRSIRFSSKLRIANIMVPVPT